jgi:hypothetical protein
MKVHDPSEFTDLHRGFTSRPQPFLGNDECHYGVLHDLMILHLADFLTGSGVADDTDAQSISS